MSDFAPQIVKIEKVENHPKANALDIATVLGDYPVIIKRGEYKVGDLASYIPIDAIVPDTEQFYFLCPKAYIKYMENGELKTKQDGPKYKLGEVSEKYRIIKAKRILDVYSMGLLMPPADGLKIGDSIVEVFNLKKWEEEEEENIPALPKIKRTGANAEKAPTDWFVPHYDIENLRKYLYLFENFDEEIILLEKCHGSNFFALHDGNKLWVKSRNFYKKYNTDDPWWDAAIRHNLEEKLKQYPMLGFYAELTGQVKNFLYDAEIKGGKLLTKLHFFDIYDVKNNKFLDYDDKVRIFKELNLSPVPELYRGKWLGKEAMYEYAEGKSTLNSKTIREGFVLNLTKEKNTLSGSRFQFKFIGQGYTLQK